MEIKIQQQHQEHNTESHLLCKDEAAKTIKKQHQQHTKKQLKHLRKHTTRDGSQQ